MIKIMLQLYSYSVKLTLCLHVFAPGEQKLVGYALGFFTYASFKGQAFFMEDLFVLPEHRGSGIGTALWRKLAQVRAVFDTYSSFTNWFKHIRSSKGSHTLVFDPTEH